MQIPNGILNHHDEIRVSPSVVGENVHERFDIPSGLLRMRIEGPVSKPIHKILVPVSTILRPRPGPTLGGIPHNGECFVQMRMVTYGAVDNSALKLLKTELARCVSFDILCMNGNENREKIMKLLRKSAKCIGLYAIY